MSANRVDNGEFRQGWRVVLAALVGVGLGLSPIPFYEIGLFAPELAREFHWGIGDVFGGVMFMMIGVLIASPIVGYLADRYGVRMVTLVSIVFFSIGLALFALQNGSLWLYYGNWLLVAIAGAGTLPITWTRVINQWFEVHKGLALGLTLTGTGISSFLLKPATSMVIAGWGWRAGFLFLALLPLLIALPLAWSFFTEKKGARDLVKNADTAQESGGIPFREAMKDWRFWIMVAFILPVAFSISGQISNLEIILTSRGASREFLISTVPFLGLAIIAGRLFGGWLIDHYWAPAVTVVLLGLSAASALLVVHSELSYGTALFCVIGAGIAAGVEFDILAFLIARYFGPRNYTSIYGMLYAFFAVGSGVAPFIYGRIYDATKSYEFIVNAGSIGLFVPALLLLFLGRYRYTAQAKV